MFLTQGVTKKYPDYRDPRTQTIPMAMHFARCAEILVSITRIFIDKSKFYSGGNKM